MSAKRRTKMSKNIFAVCQQVVSVSGIQGRFREGFEILLVAAMLYGLQQFRWELISLAQQGGVPVALHESVDDAEYRVLSGAWWWSGSASDVVVEKEEKVERLTTKFDIGTESRPRHARNAAPAERWIYHLETRQLRNDLKTSPPIDSRDSYIIPAHTPPPCRSLRPTLRAPVANVFDRRPDSPPPLRHTEGSKGDGSPPIPQHCLPTRRLLAS